MDRNNMYTKHLLRHIAKPKEQIQDLFISVHDAVFAATNEKQDPSTETSLKDPNIYLCDNDGEEQNGSSDKEEEDEDQGEFCFSWQYSHSRKALRRVVVKMPLRQKELSIYSHLQNILGGYDSSHSQGNTSFVLCLATIYVCYCLDEIMDSLRRKVERYTGIDLDGDGRIG